MQTPRPLGSYYILGPNENIMCLNSTVVLTRAVQRRVSGLRCIVVLLLHKQKFPEETWVPRPLRACWVAVVPSCPALTAILDYKQKSCSSSGDPPGAGGELLVCFYTEVTELNEDDRHQKPDRVHPQKMNFWCHKLLMILINRRTPECVFVGVPQVQSNSAHRQETHGCVIQVLIHFIQAEELPGKQLTHPSRPRSLPKFAVT